MKVTVNTTKNFKSEANPLLKKYPSLSADLLLLEQQLILNPKLGTDLGKSKIAYKEQRKRQKRWRKNNNPAGKYCGRLNGTK